MIRFVLSQIRERPGRSAALGVAVLVSSVAFVLLVGSARSGELKVQGSVQSNFRPAYDVLVRPRGSKTPLERSEGLVRDNYLSGIFGGITLKQWHEIENLPGVNVAAPIANIGYTAAFANMPFSVDRYLTSAPVQILRVRTNYVTPDGSRYPAATSYVYVTRNGVFTEDKTASGGPPAGELDQGHRVNPCGGFVRSPFAGQSFGSELFPFITCYSMRSGRPESLGSSSASSGQVTTEVGGSFPVFLAAIDPVQEAKLLSVDKTIVSGRYLRPSEGVTTRKRSNPVTHQPEGYRYVPVLAANRTYIGDRLETQIDRLQLPTGVDSTTALAAGSCSVAYLPCPEDKVLKPPRGSGHKTGLAFVRSLRAVRVGEQDTGFDPLYRSLLAGFADQRNAVAPDSYWAVSDVRYRRQRGVLVPKTVSNPPSAYVSAFNTALPWDNKDVQFRHLATRQGDNTFASGGILNRPFLRVVGKFNPSGLPGFSPLARVPLETYYPPLLTAADAKSKAVLQGKALLPTQNLGDYIQQPPLFLTTIASLPAFLNEQYFHGVPEAQRRAPISAIRVRVSGVSGADSASIARIDSVALRIHERTGLDVDITAGSSPHPLTVSLPPGKFGRPQLLLKEGWSKKGVSLSFLHGVDRKRLALFTLIPLLCCLLLGNGVFAAARSRRGEIGALLTIGWSRSAIFRVLLGETLIVGLTAGLIGIGVAAAITELFGLDMSPAAAAAVLPTALTLTLVAGLVPAWRASAGAPLDALRPPVVGGARGGQIDRLAGLAFVNLRRVPGRTTLGALGLALGACALTVLVAVESAFNGVLAGTVLGDAISVQIRGFDYLAVGLVICLATLSVADVLYVNLRERQAELVTLRTLGWQQRHLAEVVLAEALMIGLAASVVGALAGVAIGWGALAAPILPVVLGCAAAIVGGLAAAALASILPMSQIGRLTPPTVLAAEQ